MSTCLTDNVGAVEGLVQKEAVTDVARIPGLDELWSQTTGDRQICIAILDGPVDLSHPSLRDAALTQIDLDEVTDSSAIEYSDHGTHVASILFGSHDGPVKGVAPNCRGLIIPIFRYGADGALEPCSQARLAKAIRTAVRYGANVINVSAGQFSSHGEASPELRAAIEECGEDVLIVAAAGNDGCDCLHVPGAHPSVLAVGAMDAEGSPLPFSNWGEAYRDHGVLAPGERVLGAAGDGGVKVQSGTSFATPIVSGVAGLLLSLQRQLGIVPNAKSIRNTILETTHGCDPQTETQCERVLAGRLSISGCTSVVKRGAKTMQSATNNPTVAASAVPAVADNVRAAVGPTDSIEASACCEGCAGDDAPFVYAVGELQYDFPSVLREHSVQQNMDHIDAAPSYVPQARSSTDFLRHLFGYSEVHITEMEIGDIEEIEVMSSNYRLTISEKVGVFRLKYLDLKTADISATADAAKIDEEITKLAGVGEHDVKVTDLSIKDSKESVFLIEFQSTATRSVLEVSQSPNAKVESLGRLKVTVSDGMVESSSLNLQVAFNGIGIGEGANRKSSVLNSSKAMFIRHVLEPHEKDRQIIYVEADQVEEKAEFSYSEPHYYIPTAYEVKHEHRPNLYDASAVIWKLNRGQMEVYGIVPDGKFAESAYQELAEFYMNHCGLTKTGLNYYYYEKAGRLLPWDFAWDPCFNDPQRWLRADLWEDRNLTSAKPLVSDRSERVAIPGILQGEVQLITGVRLPAIKPDMRGTAEWSQDRMLAVLLDAVKHSASGAQMEKVDSKVLKEKIQTILERLDNSVRNPGLSPEHRALNHAATRLFGALGAVAGELLANDPAAVDRAATTYELDDIVVKRSEIGYAGSDCWDVEVSFFNPKNREEALVVVTQTVDVNDTIPAMTDKPRKFRRR